MPFEYMFPREGNDCGRARQKRTRTPDITAKRSQDNVGTEMRMKHQQNPEKLDGVEERHTGALSEKDREKLTCPTHALGTESGSASEINVVDEDDDDLQLALALSASLAESACGRTAAICSISEDHEGAADTFVSRGTGEESRQQEELVLVNVPDSPRYNNGTARIRGSIDCSEGNNVAISGYTKATRRNTGKPRKNRRGGQTIESRYKRFEEVYVRRVCNGVSTGGPGSPGTADTRRSSVGDPNKDSSNRGINNTVDCSSKGSSDISSLHHTRDTIDTGSNIPAQPHRVTVRESVPKPADEVFDGKNCAKAEASLDQAQQEKQLLFHGPQQPASTVGAPYVSWSTRSAVTGQHGMLGGDAEDDEALWRNAFGERRRERRERRRGLSNFDDENPDDMEPLLGAGKVERALSEMEGAKSEERTDSGSHATMRSVLPATCAACDALPNYPATAIEKDSGSGCTGGTASRSSTAPDGYRTRVIRTNHCDSSNGSRCMLDNRRSEAKRHTRKTFTGNASSGCFSSAEHDPYSSSCVEGYSEKQGRCCVEHRDHDEEGVHPAFSNNEVGALEQEQSAQRSGPVRRGSQSKKSSMRFQQQISGQQQALFLQPREQQHRGQLSGQLSSVTVSAIHGTRLNLKKGQENENRAAGRRTACRRCHFGEEHQHKTVNTPNEKRERKRRKKGSSEDTGEEAVAWTEESTTTISDETATDFPDDEDDEETQFQVALAVSLSATDAQNFPVSCNLDSNTSMASSSSSTRSLNSRPGTASGSVGFCAQGRQTALHGTADTASSTGSNNTITSTRDGSSSSGSGGGDRSSSSKRGRSSRGSNGTGSNNRSGSCSGSCSSSCSKGNESDRSTGVSGCDNTTNGNDGRRSGGGECDRRNSAGNERESSTGDGVSRSSSRHVSGRRENKRSVDKIVEGEGRSRSPHAGAQESKEVDSCCKKKNCEQNHCARVDGLVIHQRAMKTRCVTISETVHRDTRQIVKGSFGSMFQRAGERLIDSKTEGVCNPSTKTGHPPAESDDAVIATPSGEVAHSAGATDSGVDAGAVSFSFRQCAAAVIHSPALEDYCTAGLSVLAPSIAAMKIATRPSSPTTTPLEAASAAKRVTQYVADDAETAAKVTCTERPTAGAPEGIVASTRSGPAAPAAVHDCVPGDSDENSLNDHSSDPDFELERKSGRLVSSSAYETGSGSNERMSPQEAVEAQEDIFSDVEVSENRDQAKQNYMQAASELCQRASGQQQHLRQQKRQQVRKCQLEQVQRRRRRSERGESRQERFTTFDVPPGLTVSCEEKGGRADEERQSEAATLRNVDGAAVTLTGEQLLGGRLTTDVGDGADVCAAHVKCSRSPSQSTNISETRRKKPRAAAVVVKASAENVEAEFLDTNADVQEGDPEEQKIPNRRPRDVWVSKVSKNEQKGRKSRRRGQQQMNQRSEATAVAAAAVKLWKHEKLHDACMYVWAALTEAISVPLQQRTAGVRTDMRRSEGVQQFLIAIDEQRQRRQVQVRTNPEPNAGDSKSVADSLVDSRVDEELPLQGCACLPAIASQKGPPASLCQQQHLHSEEQQDLRLPTAEQLQRSQQQLPPPLPFITLEQLGRTAAAVGLLNLDVDELLKMIATAAGAGAVSIAEKQQQQQQQPQMQIERLVGKMGRRRMQQGILSSKACSRHYAQALGKTTLSYEEFVAFFHHGLGLKVESNGKVW